MSGTTAAAPGMATWLGVFTERLDIIGDEAWVVTISRAGYDARRRIFPDRTSAYQYALEQAEWHELPFFDLAGVPAE